MEFIHCQSCGHWPQFFQDIRLKYFFSACGRLYCEPCLNRQDNKCGACKTQCKFAEVNAQASMDIKAYFMDPMTMLRDSLKKPLQVLQFQQNLQREAMRLVGKVLESQKRLKSENENLKVENGKLSQSNEELKNQINDLRRKLDEVESASARASTNFVIPSPPFSSHKGRSNSTNDPLNLFNETTTRPNAHVQPIIPQPSQSMGLFGQTQAPMGPPRQLPPSVANSEISSFRDTRRPFSRINGRSPSTPSSGTSYRTPSSLNSFGGQTLYMSHADMNRSTPLPRESPGPELICRLRNLKCAPASSQR